MLSPRRVRAAPNVALHECRMLKVHTKPASVLRYVEGKVKKWRGVQRWYAQCYVSQRSELVVQVVAERYAASSRNDNLFNGWRRVVVRMLPGDVAVKALKRSAWHMDTLVDTRAMYEDWPAACAKVCAEALAVDKGAVKCSYVEPALPSGAAPVSAPASAPVTTPDAVVQAAPKSLAVPVADIKTLSVPISSMLGAQR